MPIKIKPATGAGSVSLEAQNAISSDFTLTLPGVTGTVNTSGAVNQVPAGSVSAPSIFPTGDTNTGIYFPAADTIGFVEGGVESARLDSSGNLRFNSGYGSVAVAYGCRAWATFTGTSSSPITPLASGNVSSVTKVSTGVYSINFVTAFPDANYATIPMFQPTVSNAGSDSFAINPTTTLVEIRHFEANTPRDSSYTCVAIFR